MRNRQVELWQTVGLRFFQIKMFCLHICPSGTDIRSVLKQFDRYSHIRNSQNIRQRGVLVNIQCITGNFSKQNAKRIFQFQIRLQQIGKLRLRGS